MLKVLFVSSANRNGIGTIVKNQLSSLTRHRIDVGYYGIKGRGLKGYLSNVIPLRAHILKFQPDLIHAHYSLSGIVAGLSLTRKPLVVSLMGSDTNTGYFARCVIRLFHRTLWGALIVKTKRMLNDISIKQAVIIPNGVDCSRFKPLDKIGLKKQFSYPENKTIVLFLADPSRESKNFHLAKLAFQLIDQKKTELHVRFNIPRDQIPLILSVADVVLLTSRWEGSPNVVKEAMACNCPVVSTDVGDVAWLFGNESGHFLTGFDPQDVAAKLEKAIEFSKKNGQTNGRDRIIEIGLDSRTIANRIIGVYEEVLGHRA